ncbi:MAG: outer membrane protein [Hyphomicrobiales bacterium]|jgi:outer membrane protein|nr:outer membrane protein [Hyphomicrobiales bacterium]
MGNTALHVVMRTTTHAWRKSRATLDASVVLIGSLAWCAPAAAEKIEAALARAYQNNPQLNAQRATVRQTDENVPQALSGYRPTVSATASAGKQHLDLRANIPGLLPGVSSVTVNDTSNTLSAGVTASQNLFNAQTPNRTRAAENQVFAARETLRVIEQSVLLSAASVYMDVLRDSANLDLQRSNIRVLRETLKVTQDRFDAGSVTATDVDQTQAQLAAGEASLYAAESTLITTKANYRRVIGTAPNDLSPGMPVDRFSPRTVEAAVAQATLQNPSVTAAMYDVDVAQLQVRIAEAGLYPTLVLQGSSQYQQFSSPDSTIKLFNSTVQAKLTVPIYQGGSEYSAIRQNKEAVGQQRFTLDQVRDQVRASVVQYWGQLDAAKAQTEAATRQVRYSESALNGVRNEARAGSRTTLDVLNALQTLLNARVTLINAQHDRVVASYSVLSAIGRLSPAVLGLPAEIYDPRVHYHQVRDSWIGVRTPDGR